MFDKKWGYWILGIVLLCILLFTSSRNKKDQTWDTIDSLYNAEFLDLKNSKDSIEILFQSIHPYNNIDHEGWNRLSDPFEPTMLYSKFKNHLNQVLNHKHIVFNSTPGTRTTTVTERLVNFISTDKEHVLEVLCAPSFELKLHEKYLSTKDGLLIKFLIKAINHSEERFFLIIDNLDKINPESFWGPDMWKLLGGDSDHLLIDSVYIHLPDNFYMISVVHSGITAIHQLSDEHYRRIGQKRYVDISTEELIMYVRDKANEGNLEQSNKNLLSDKNHIQHFIYTFAKSNEIIKDKFGIDYQLGQWSDYRKHYNYNNIQELLNVFADHINSLKPDANFKITDLSTVQYAIENDGLLKNSNWLAQKTMWLEEKGYLTEFVVGLSFFLITGLVSLFFLKRRERVLSEYIKRLGGLISQHENGEVELDYLVDELEKVKKEVDELALSKKINYNEANFFYSFFDDKIRRIETSKEIHAQFNDLLDVFLEDDYLSQSEHQKLRSFLDRIKNKISNNDYNHYDEVVANLRKKYQESWRVS